MKNTKFEELSEYQRKRLETAEECANDIKKYEEQTEKIVSPKVRKFILDMYLFGLEHDLSKDQVFEMYEKQLLK